MFVKENTKAFIYVSHYLFTILDPETFNKRFHWPLTDRRYEAEYRTEAVGYINDLIKQGKLKPSLADPARPGQMLKKISATHVVHAGGLRFMQLLLDIIKMIMAVIVERKGCKNVTSKSNVTPHLMALKQQNRLLKQNCEQYITVIRGAHSLVKETIAVLDAGMLKVIPNLNAKKEVIYTAMKDLKETNSKRFEIIKAEDKEIERCLNDYRELCKLIRTLLQPYEVKEIETKGFSAVVATLKQQFQDKSSADDDDAQNTNDKLTQTLNLVSLSLPRVVDLMQKFEKINIYDLKTNSKKLSPIVQCTSELTAEISRLIRKVGGPPGNERKKTTPSVDISALLSRQLILIPPPITINLHRRTNPNLLPRIMRRPNDSANVRNQPVLDSLIARMNNLTFMPSSSSASSSNLSSSTGAKKKQQQPPRRPVIDSEALFKKKPSVARPKRSLSPILSYSAVMNQRGQHNGQHGQQVLSSTVLDYSMQSQMTTPQMPFQLDSPVSTIKANQVASRQCHPLVETIREETKQDSDKSSGFSTPPTEMSEETSSASSFNQTVLSLTVEREASSQQQNNTGAENKSSKSGFDATTMSLNEEKENIFNTSDNILVDDSF